MATKAQIVATIGPASSNESVFSLMVEKGADVARLNMSWGNHAEKSQQIEIVRKTERKLSRKIPIIVDLPGPRVQEKEGHTYDKGLPALTKDDIGHIKFASGEKVEYIALSFVGSARDVIEARKTVHASGGRCKIIAKIERKAALDDIDAIVHAADAIMVARGDLGNDIPLEKVPFAQALIIEKARKAGKPVITATEMLLSMTEKNRPTRAEVTDVANAILQGSDAIMLSEETARGKYPVEAVEMMERIAKEAERHQQGIMCVHKL